MKRYKRERKNNLSPEEKDAIKYLSLISERQTAYIQDWAKINLIRQQDVQESNQLQRDNQNKNDKQLTFRNTAIITTNNQIHRSSQNNQNRNTKHCFHTTTTIKKVQNATNCNIVESLDDKNQIKTTNNPSSNATISAKAIIKNQLQTSSPNQCSTLQHNKMTKPLQVYIQDFATVSLRRNYSHKNKGNLGHFSRYADQPQFHRNKHNIQPKQRAIPENNQQHQKLQQPTFSRKGISSSMDYIQKIRKLSLPWLKNLPKIEKKPDTDIQKEAKDRQQNRRLNQLIKNKIRRKQSNKFLIHKKLNQIYKSQKNSVNQQSCDQKSKGSTDKEKNEIKLLKSWLDNNRSKKKRSISSLLTEHFQNKYYQMKKQRQRVMSLKSAKVISIISQYQKKFY